MRAHTHIPHASAVCSIGAALGLFFFALLPFLLLERGVPLLLDDDTAGAAAPPSLGVEGAGESPPPAGPTHHEPMLVLGRRRP